jgi:ComF family protein
VHIFDLIFPKRCVGCGSIGKYFCDRCRLTVRLIRPNESICPVCEKPAIGGETHPRCRTRYTIDGLTSFFRYDGVVKKAIKSIKYRFVSDLASEFVSLVPSPLMHELTSTRSNDLAIIPVPLHPSRFRERGFNQADVLGTFIAKRLNVLMIKDILVRTKKTLPQVQVKERKERLKNMERVFAFSNRAIQQCNNCIIFDDVFTTGATMRAAAGVLKRHGVQSVWGVTMAR